MKAATESSILTACLQLLQLRGVMAWRSNQGTIPLADGRPRRFRGLRGVADILGIAPDGSGRLLAIEVKRPGGRLSPDQRAFIDAVRRFGGVAAVITDVGELDELLRREFPQ